MVLSAWAAPLRHRRYRYFLLAGVVSTVGDGMWMVALPWTAIQAGGRSSDLALIFTAGSAGMISCVLVGGILADRYARKVIIASAYSVSFAALVTLAVVYQGGRQDLWELALVEFVLGACASLRAPASGTFVLELVPERDLRQANSLAMMLRTVSADMAGAALGGVAISMFSPVVVFLADALSFALAFFFLLAIVSERGTRRRVRERRPDEPGVSYRETLSYLAGQRWLWTIILWSSLALFLREGPLMVLLPFVIKNDMGGDAADHGVFLAVAGISEVAGPLLLGWRPPPGSVRKWVLITQTVGTLPLALIPFVSSVWMLYPLGVVLGCCGSIGAVYWFTFLQAAVPEEVRGRVMSFDGFGPLVLVPLSMMLAGLGAGREVAHWFFVLAGTVPGLLALVILRWTDLNADVLRTPASVTGPQPIDELSAEQGAKSRIQEA